MNRQDDLVSRSSHKQCSANTLLAVWMLTVTLLVLTLGGIAGLVWDRLL